MNKIVLSEKLANEILAYLDTRPHKEVRGLIDGMVKEAEENAKQAVEETVVEPITEVKKPKTKKAVSEVEAN